ncbi:MAG: right-handed parallel beta-helix repeat-containing protein [Dehalococcoidia bacterium]|nr:right-handed parallel beta-helix repeat-containing protein [Dehalococcoidia bacterium]
MTAKLSVHLVVVLLVFAALIGSMFVQPVPASAANDWYVATAANGGNDANSGDAAHPWEHINYAIGMAAAGDTIHIGLGTFVEQVVIDKSLTLIGTAVAPTPNGTFIEAPAVGDRTNYTSGVGLIYDYVILAHDTTNVTVSTLTAYAVAPRKAGADYYATVVFDNVIGSSGFDAGCVSGAFNNNIADIDIAVLGGSNVTVQNSSIVDFITSGVESSASVVNIVNNEINGEEPSSSCVYIETATSGLVDANAISTVAEAVRIQDGQNIIISNNEIRGTSAFDGVQCGGTGPIAIRGNEIYGFELGIAETGITTGGSIDNNEIYNCLFGISLTITSSVWISVTNNLIYDNDTGLFLRCPLEAVSSNIFYHNTIGIRAENDLAAHCNALVGNTTAGLVLLADGAFNVTNNYWGANSGPNVDGAGPGTGDLIDTNGHTVLDFDPWAAMNLTVTPATIVADGVSLSTLDLDCTRNSNYEIMGCNIPDGLQINFATTAGTLTSLFALTSGGHAVTTLRSSTTAGVATVSSVFQVLPTLTISTAMVTFTTAPVPPPMQQGINAGPGSHGASLTSITSPSALNPPNLQVTSATISSSSITAGSTVTVSADVANTGGASGAAVVKVYLNSEVAGSQGVKVDGGSTTPVIFTLTPSQPGEYSVRVNNVQAGVLNVTGGNNNDILFAIAFAAFIVILAVLLIVYMRRRRMAV